MRGLGAQSLLEYFDWRGEPEVYALDGEEAFVEFARRVRDSGVARDFERPGSRGVAVLFPNGLVRAGRGPEHQILPTLTRRVAGLMGLPVTFKAPEAS